MATTTNTPANIAAYNAAADLLTGALDAAREALAVMAIIDGEACDIAAAMDAVDAVEEACFGEN